MKSGKGFVFTLEATITLVCFVVFIGFLASISFEDYSDLFLYKQTGDYAQIAMKKHCEHNESCLSELRGMLNRNNTGSKCMTVTRTSISNSMNYTDVEFILCA